MTPDKRTSACIMCVAEQRAILEGERLALLYHPHKLTPQQKDDLCTKHQQYVEPFVMGWKF